MASDLGALRPRSVRISSHAMQLSDCQDETLGEYKDTAYQNLIEEVLNELFLKGSRCEKAMEVGTEKLGHKIAVKRGY